MKAWWRSKTLWINALVLVASVADILAGLELTDAVASALTQTSVDGSEQAVAPLAAANLALRAVTRRALRWGRQ